MGWDHRAARHWAGNVLRNLAVVLVDAAETVDPQPDVDLVHPFTIHGPTSTTTGEARITWHKTG